MVQINFQKPCLISIDAGKFFYIRIFLKNTLFMLLVKNNHLYDFQNPQCFSKIMLRFTHFAEVTIPENYENNIISQWMYEYVYQKIPGAYRLTIL